MHRQECLCHTDGRLTGTHVVSLRAEHASDDTQNSWGLTRNLPFSSGLESGKTSSLPFSIAPIQKITFYGAAMHRYAHWISLAVICSLALAGCGGGNQANILPPSQQASVFITGGDAPLPSVLA